MGLIVISYHPASLCYPYQTPDRYFSNTIFPLTVVGVTPDPDEVKRYTYTPEASFEPSNVTWCSPASLHPSTSVASFRQYHRPSG
jgi:hypothetical protein